MRPVPLPDGFFGVVDERERLLVQDLCSLREGRAWIARRRGLVAILCVVLVLLAGCGEDWASYDKPVGAETDWHACMRQHAPLDRSACRDLK